MVINDPPERNYDQDDNLKAGEEVSLSNMLDQLYDLEGNV
jgi:hypothetical protein